jgi:hypothetical protein
MVFHISLLEPICNDPLPGQTLPGLEYIMIEGELEYKVEEVLDSYIF